MAVFAVFALICFGKLSAISIPYQDATAEMLQKQAQQIADAENLLIIIGLLFIVSIVYCVVITKQYKR